MFSTSLISTSMCLVLLCFRTKRLREEKWLKKKPYRGKLIYLFSTSTYLVQKKTSEKASATNYTK